MFNAVAVGICRLQVDYSLIAYSEMPLLSIISKGLIGTIFESGMGIVAAAMATNGKNGRWLPETDTSQRWFKWSLRTPSVLS